ncbi:MAG: CheR family methyltransferase, partial [Candidatus Hodarchaeota archaeon]
RILTPEFRNGPASIWSAGCAIGAEPYTLAILVKNYRASHPELRDVRILATDLNPDLLEKASLGEYSSAILEETPPYFQTKYFQTLEESRFKVTSEIRSLVKFKQHDLFSSVCTGYHDAIVCRNVIIYFNKEQKEKLLRLFAKSLVPGGFLFLGGSETLPPEFSKIFDQRSFEHRIYRRK